MVNSVSQRLVRYFALKRENQRRAKTGGRKEGRRERERERGGGGRKKGEGGRREKRRERAVDDLNQDTAECRKTMGVFLKKNHLGTSRGRESG